METNLIEKKIILDEKGMERALKRISMEIIERNKGTQDLYLVGIYTGGVYLAERLSRMIAETEGSEIITGQIDITLYRDDVFIGLPQPIVGETRIPFNINGKVIVLVDDVLYTGRTVRAALDALIDFGRPKAIWLAVLVDRGHRELPIRADFVGLEIQTERNQSVKVHVKEISGKEQVVLREKSE